MFHSVRKHPWRSAAIFALAAFVGLNLLAFMHAWSMTHFVSRGGHAVGDESNVEARAIFAALGGPKQLLEFPDLGHGVGMSSDPDRWRHGVQGFLSGLAAAK